MPGNRICFQKWLMEQFGNPSCRTLHPAIARISAGISSVAKLEKVSETA
jgi:hypothetical protein